MHHTKIISGILTICLFFTGCESQTGTSTEKTLLDKNIEIQKLSNDEFEFLEGPAWDGDKLVYFTDIPNNTIHTYNLETKKTGVFTNESNGANGLMFDRESHLISCEQNTGLLSRIDISNNAREIIVDSFAGKRFNRPNDLVVDKANGIYFTDPTWADEYPQQHKGLYYQSANGDIEILATDFDKPNGVILSPDEKFLYVGDSNTFNIKRYTILSPGKIGERIDFAELPHEVKSSSSSADGMAISNDGELFVTYQSGVAIFNKEGESLGVIQLPEQPSNATFVGKDLDTLFVTAKHNIYSIKLNVKGIYFPQ